jgi:cellulose biosynthesis protein BcsQ
MATIAVYSLKGGVGKTTVSVNLAYCAAILGGHRTLLWDLDPQGASTFLMGLNPRQSARKIFAKDMPPAELIRQSAWPGLDVLPADASLRGLDKLFDTMGKKRRLAKLIAGLAKSYDRIVLDCPPGLTETSEQVMHAADLIIVPVIPSPLSRRALDDVQLHLAKELKITTEIMPVWSMVDRRRSLHREAESGWPAVPMASVIEQMAVRRAPIGAIGAKGPAQDAFTALWRAVEARLGK